MVDHNFTDEEFEELKKLVILHRRGVFCDDIFEFKTEKILKGREFPIFSKLPEEIEKKQIEEPKLDDLESITSCGTKSSKERRKHLSKQKELKGGSLVAKAISDLDAQILEEQREKKLEEIRGHLILDNSNSSNPSLDLDPLSLALTEHEQQQSFKKTAKSALGVIGVALLTLLIAFSNPVEDFIYSIKDFGGAKISLNSLKNVSMQSSLKPLFGPSAIANCKVACKSKNCETRCSELSLEGFAKRITLEVETPSDYAKTIKTRCTQESLHRKEALEQRPKVSKVKWNDELLTANKLLVMDKQPATKRNFANLKLMHQNILGSHASLSFPIGASEKEKKTTINMSSALCIKAHESLTKLGSVLAIESKDNYSNGFYSRMTSELNQSLYEQRLALKAGLK